MNVLDNVYRLFMFALPYALCLAAYVWVGKKALRVPQKASRIVALIIIAAGLGYTLYRMVRSIGGLFTNDNFEYIIIIVAVAVLALASIVMALGEPEEGNKRTDEQEMRKEEGKENGLEQ